MLVNHQNIKEISQFTAADPAHSAWVAASAGSGKTKVLTDRVLRLLLAGSAPSRILCITYTKAAAAEMSNRLSAILTQWAIATDDALANSLAELTGSKAEEEQMTRARTLFARVLDAPVGVRILTIHSFCQSLLKRFPVEAGIEPHFSVIDDRTANELLFNANQRLLSEARENKDSALSDAVAQVCARASEYSFTALMDELISQRRKISALLAEGDDLARYTQRLYAAHGLDASVTQENLLAALCSYSADEEALLLALPGILHGSATLDEMHKKLHAWCEKPTERMQEIENFLSAYLTKSLEPRKTLLTKKTAEAYPHMLQLMQREQARALQYSISRNALETVQLSVHMMQIAMRLLAYYGQMKARYSYMDYDDLIINARDLLLKPDIAPWVLYKLDGGLDHLLIDEAQDTSVEQWQIIEVLVEEFFAGMTARNTHRTLFVVGDAKQSIFGFNGAAPDAFHEMRHHFRRKIENAKKQMEYVPLNKSFRSTEAVLSLVDAVFAHPAAREGLSSDEAVIRHVAHRVNMPGRVELWPLIEKPESELQERWPLPQSYQYKATPRNILATRIAKTISGWLSAGRLLPGKNRPIQASDIMILLRKRGEGAVLMHSITRALKREGIAVSGVDRMVLTDNLAVQDIVNLLHFLLLPEDDLSLAALMRSPLLNFSEDELFELAHNRNEKTLWMRLREAQNKSTKFEQSFSFLSRLLAKTDYITPHALIANILEVEGGRKKLAARLGEEVGEPLDELLSQALAYETLHPATLQGFLQWLVSETVQVKRDMEQGRNEVRIMTVHASKGLQAPVVFLPDTTGVVRVKERFFWHDDANGAPLFLWGIHPKNGLDSLHMRLLESEKKRQRDEYHRLLYVALTRAEDELYICGVADSSKKQDSENNDTQSHWYDMATSGMKQLETTQEERLFPKEDAAVTILNYSCGLAPQAVAGEQKEKTVHKHPLPEYLKAPPQAEPAIPKPLSPSRLEDNTLFSPIGNSQHGALQRGVHIHRLLELLVSMPPSQYKGFISRYCERHSTIFPDTIALTDEIMAVIEDPDIAGLFTAQALTEVPVSGVLQRNGKVHVVAGQIDRLCVTGDVIYIIDYKTGGDVPADISQVPAAYIRQMALYAEIIKQIYPERKLLPMLLYTAGPRLISLPQARLEDAISTLFAS